jgi:hypothetical protein
MEGLNVTKNPNARIQWANYHFDRVVDPVDMLNYRARSCPRSEDAAFWILTSAAAHLNGYNLDDGEPSTVRLWWEARYGRLDHAESRR